MFITGYRFAYRLLNAPSDYIPSLIGANPKLGTVNPSLVAYFESEDTQHDLRLISDILPSKYAVEDTRGKNLILHVRCDKATFYIPGWELVEAADGAGLIQLRNLVYDLLPNDAQQ